MTPPELSRLGIAQASSGVRRKEFSPVELAQTCLKRIESLDGKLHSFITVTADLALEQARKAEHELGEFADSLSVAVELSSNTSYHPFWRGNR
jgi:Asp-tRNA(Asn)/Glu-tRNA(Gln) amidotransferase A subunit family amidase